MLFFNLNRSFEVHAYFFSQPGGPVPKVIEPFAPKLQPFNGNHAARASSVLQSEEIRYKNRTNNTKKAFFSRAAFHRPPQHTTQRTPFMSVAEVASLPFFFGDFFFFPHRLWFLYSFPCPERHFRRSLFPPLMASSLPLVSNGHTSEVFDGS